MKKGMKILAASLTAAMVVSGVPVSAAPRSSSYVSSFSLKGWLESIFNKGSDNGATETEAPDESVKLDLVEDESTVENGTMLRASTYAVDDSGITPAAVGDTTISGKNIKYFPVTLYNYDDRYNNAVHQKEVEENSNLTKWNGIYFGGNSHGANVKEGDNYNYSTGGKVSYTEETVNYSDRNNSKYTSGNYYYRNNGNYYQVTGLKCTRDYYYYYYYYTWTITCGSQTFSSNNESISLYLATDTASTGNLSYANWNKWTGDFSVDDQDTHGNKTYSGLVNSSLDADGNISFTKTEAGIFTSDTTNKDVYTNVEMPFVYDDETKTYTFDANETGVYFHQDSSQGTSATPSSNSKLYFSTTPQSHNFSAQDGRTRGWFPFNNTSSVTTAADGTADYFFGMQASIPFTMTTNGCLKETDNNSDAITFEFSGDDDVWVFIDGKLVLDIGGVRNGMNATLNFADNTWEISAMKETIGNVSRPAQDVNDASMSGRIFNDAAGTGTLNQTRQTFAATDSHTLTVFYLERGAGSSNCKIKFNLPMKDSVSVKKIADQSKTKNGTLSDLTAEEQTMVDNTNFGFTLYKDGKAVANTNYNLLNADGNYLTTVSTDANGHFTLKAGQTAKFVGEINDNTYYVVEDSNSSFQTPAYAYTANAANGASQTAAADGWTGMKVNAKGSDESEDSIVFTCTNYLDAELPNPTSQPADDEIVVDYGLPVVIDVLSNDVHKGSTYELTSVSGARYGEAVKNADGTITYRLTKPLDGVEVLTYTATANTPGAEVEAAVGTAKVYIIPATSMYYEENFSDLVTFTGSWENVGTAQTEPQEPGVVGTVSDSPYGSDAAYLNDSGDSNGTSKHIDTTNGAAKFSYTFAGTGTSFFARATDNTGYMRVDITDSNGETIQTRFIDTKYVPTEGTDVGTLYNIPVFTYEADNYGEYTVTVTIAKKSVVCGGEFWLDGIRVMKPLNETDANVSIARSAYSADGEANMTNVTLRDKLIADYTIDQEDGTVTWTDDGNFVLFTDNNGKITLAQDYVSDGPKEEVYLNSGQSVTFSLYDWDPNSNRVYLGIKAPSGSGTVKINDHVLNINNTADCYYDISAYDQITTDTDGVKIATFKVEAASALISVTNIKVTGSAEFTIVGTNKDVDNIVTAMDEADDNTEKGETLISDETAANAAGETEIAAEPEKETSTEEESETQSEAANSEEESEEGAEETEGGDAQ